MQVYFDVQQRLNDNFMIFVYENPGKVRVEWEPSVRTMVDTWGSLAEVTVADFREAVLVQSLPYGIAHGVQAYIVDNSAALGAFSQEVVDFISCEVHPAVAQGGVKFLVTIESKESPLANITARKYKDTLKPFGVQLATATTLAEAMSWLEQHHLADP